jgi:SSS family solute:Na+ symporter
VTWGFAALLRFPGLETGDLATPTLLASDIVPTALGIIVMIGIIAAAVSTIDSIMLTLSSMVTRDVFLVVKKDSTEAQQLAVGKLVLPVIAVMAYLFAQLKIDLIAVLSVSASAGLLVMVPPIVGAFFWRRGTAEGALAAILLSGGLVLTLQMTSTQLFGQGSGVWGLLASVGLFIGVSLMTKAPTERATEFMDTTRKELREKAAV